MATINWGFLYRPRVQVGGVWFDMPLPIMQTEERFVQKFRTIDIPLQDGAVFAAPRRGPLTVSFSGLIAKNTMAGVLHTKYRMQELFINAAGQPFTFYRYYDAARHNYRWYEDCLASSLTFSATNTDVYTLKYNLTVQVPSGIENELVTTTGEAPGAGANISGLYRDGSYQGDEDDGVSPQAESLPSGVQKLFGPLIIKLPTGGVFLIKNTSGQVLFKVDYLGAVQTISPIETVDEISEEVE